MDALVCIVICTAASLCVLACMNTVMKGDELMKSFEERINQSWEEIYENLRECEACPLVEEEEEMEAS